MSEDSKSGDSARALRLIEGAWSESAALAETLSLAQEQSVREQTERPPSGLERYQLQGELGRGGMGHVKEAFDRQFQRHVAIKELTRADSPLHRARFQLEALITGNLEHPGVAAVYERGVREDGVPFYVMRKVRGRTLAEALSAAKTPQARLALLSSLVKVAHTLAYAHQHGIIHRDVKPQNIILGQHGEAILLDWGIAKLRDGEKNTPLPPLEEHPETQHGSVVGTPAYMAPEQAAGDVNRISEATDVFALGAILYHIMVGNPPYAGGTARALVAKAAQREILPISKAAPTAPQSLREICERAMERDPRDRYQTAAEMAEVLEAVLARAVLQEEPRAARYLALAVVGVAVVALVTTIIIMWLFAPSLDQGPWSAASNLGWSALTATLLGVEWRTRGRYRLRAICLVFVCIVFANGIISAILNMQTALGGVAEGQFTDPLRFHRLLARGISESLWAIPSSAVLGLFLLLLWAVVTRQNQRPTNF